MICKQCGRELPDHAIYCRYCGARIERDEPVDVEQNNKRPPRGHRWLPLLLTVLVLAALIAGIIFLLRSCKKAEPAPEPEPTQVEEPAVEPDAPIDYTLRIDGEDNIEAGKSVILRAIILPETEIDSAEWTSSDKKIATVLDGVVTGIDEGDAMIQCRIVTKDGQELSAEMPFRVLPKPVAYKAELEPKTLELHAGSAGELAVSVTSDPPGEDVTPEVEWESSDPKIAAVTDGRVQAVGEGAARITANVTLPDGSAVSLQSTVRVSPAESNPTPEASQITPQKPAAEPAQTPAPAPAPAQQQQTTPVPAPQPAAPDPAGAELQRTEEYIIANVDKDIISLDSLRTLSDVDLILARNEIFARHGRRFNTTWIQEYFDKQSWYEGTIAPEDFDPDVLNDVEHANVDRMQYVEKNH
jgi:hypothetical protein